MTVKTQSPAFFPLIKQVVSFYSASITLREPEWQQPHDLKDHLIRALKRRQDELTTSYPDPRTSHCIPSTTTISSKTSG